MSDEIAIRDRRQGGWYYVDNEIYDMQLSCEALAMYNSIARFANNDTAKAYFSGRKFMGHHKIGKAKFKAAKDELINRGLISETGEKTNVGAVYYTLLNTKSNPVPRQDIGAADAAEGVRLTRPTNKTNKTRLNNTVANATDDMDNELKKACEYIQNQTGCTLNPEDKWTKIWWYRASKDDGLDNLKTAIKNFCLNKPNVELGRWDWVSFLRFQAKRSGFLPKKKTVSTVKCTLPDFSHIQYDDAPFDEHAMDEFKVTHA